MAENILRCPKCGGEIRHTSSFCEHCGAPVEITVASNPVKQEVQEEDPEKRKAREEYFQRRAASAVSTPTEHHDNAKEISVNPVPTYTKAALTAGFLIGINIVVGAISYLPILYPPLIFMLKKKIFLGLLFGFIYPLIAVPIFKKKVKNVDRRGVRRSLRFIMVFNWMLCAAPIFMGITLIVENFLAYKVPYVTPLQFHNILLVLSYIIFGIFAYLRFISVKQNKSIGEIQMALHFDTPTVFAFSLFSIIILVFAVMTAGS